MPEPPRPDRHRHPDRDRGLLTAHPSAILTQNARSTSRRGGGRPGEHIGARPVFVDTHAAVRPNVTPLLIGVSRRPLESAQYTSIAFTERLLVAGVDASVGSVGDAYDNVAQTQASEVSCLTELLTTRGGTPLPPT